MRKYLWGLVILAAIAAFGLWLAAPVDPPLASVGPRLDARLIKQWNSDGSPARQAIFSRDGRFLATSNAAGKVIVRRATDWRPVRTLQVPGGVTSLAFSLDGGQLLTAGYDGVVRSWQLADGRLVREYAGANGALWVIDL